MCEESIFQEVDKKIVFSSGDFKKRYVERIKKGDDAFHKFIKSRVGFTQNIKNFKKNSKSFRQSKFYLDFITRDIEKRKKNIDNSFEAILMRSRQRVEKELSKKARTL